MPSLGTRFKSALTRLLVGNKAERPLVWALPIRSYAPRRGTDAIIEAYEYDPWLQALVDVVADGVACARLRAYKPALLARKGLPAYRVKALSPALRAKALREEVKAGAWVELDDHEALRMLAAPHPEFSGHTYLHLLAVYFILCGECFMRLTTGGDGRPVGFTLIPPPMVTMTPQVGAPYYFVSYNGRVERVPSEEMVWLKKPAPRDPDARGVGRGAAMADEIDTREAISTSARSTFQRGGIAAAVVSVGSKSEDIDAEEQKAELEKRYNADHGGPGQAGKVWFVAGDVSLAQVQVNYRELQTQEIKAGLRDEMREALNIPADIMGVAGGSNRSTSEEAKYTLADRAVAPLLDRIVAELNHKLLPRLDTSAVLVADDPRPASWERTLQAMTAAYNEAVYKNEARELAGLDPDPELEGQRFTPLPGARPVHDSGTSGPARNPPPARGPAAPSGDA